MKRLILALSTIIIIGCDMPGNQVNEYTPTDPNPENIEETIDEQRKGYMALSLTEWKTSTVPAIEGGSNLEINGPLFEFPSDEVISQTDPDTTVAVADGQVYIVMLVTGTSVTAAFTATAPTWEGGKQGWYKTGTTRRYVSKMTKTGSAFTDKKIYEGRELFHGPNYKIETGTGVSWFSVSSAGVTDVIRIKKSVSCLFSGTISGASGVTSDLQLYYNSSWITLEVPQISFGTGSPKYYFASLLPGDYRFSLGFTGGTVLFTGDLVGCSNSQSITTPDVYEINP